MVNRVSGYYDGQPGSDLERGRETIAFCYALMRIGAPGEFASWELDSISCLQVGATRVFQKHGVPLPWAAARRT